MEFEKPRVTKVDDKVFEGYRSRLATALLRYGYTADKITQDTELKDYIGNFVQTNVIDNKTKDAIIGISHRLAHMEVSGNQEGVFPIVHQYKWHNLVGSIIFYKDENGRCVHEMIPVEASPIVIP